MLRDIVEQIVRRRLWPIPVVASVVVVAAPLLFLKSAPQDASPAAAIAPAPSQADLPARAQRLLTTSDAAAAGGRLSRSARDPFAAPSSPRRATTAKSAGAKTSSSKAKAASKSSSKQTEPVPVVIKNADGSTPAAATSPAPPSSGGGGRSSSQRSSKSSGTSSSTSSSVPAVDVRFGARKDSPIKRRIPHPKTFELAGKVVVVFVKYSTTRHKAIFAIRPTTGVHGDIRCRRVDGICRYVDIPAGKYVRFTFVKEDGSRVSRRLDVVRVHGDA
jgi:hypothetical protein